MTYLLTEFKFIHSSSTLYQCEVIVGYLAILRLLYKDMIFPRTLHNGIIVSKVRMAQINDQIIK